MNDRHNIVIVLLLVSAAMLSMMLFVSQRSDDALAGNASSRYGDFILIHGHTPTVLMRNYEEAIGSYSPESGVPYLRLTDPQTCIRDRGTGVIEVDAGLDDVVAIDIDTGAVYGKCLTALLLDTDRLLEDNTIQALQVRLDCSHRHGADARLITFSFLKTPELGSS